MRVAGVQLDVAWEDPEANMARAAPLVAAAVDAGARVVLLPELWSTGFSMAVDRLAEPPEGPSTAFLVEAAARHDAWVGGSVPLRPRAEERPVNCFTLAAPDGAVRRYAKIHTFSYAGEDGSYGAGREPVTVDIDGCRCTLFVCYDLRFGDEFWATAAQTDCYFVVANWPVARREHWRTLLRARAIENQAYVVGVNRVGRDPHEAYVGDSAVVDPMGEVVAEGGPDEGVVVAEVDPAAVVEVRHRYRFLQDRRASG